MKRILLLVLLALLIAPASAAPWDFLFGGNGGGDAGVSDLRTLGTQTLDPTIPSNVDVYGRFNGYTSGTIDGPNLTFDFDLANIKVDLRGADQTWTKTQNGNYVKYSSSNIDIEYYVYNGFVKQNVTLKKKPYPSLSVKLTNQTGWLWMNDEANISLYDDMGVKRLSLGVPYAIGGDGERLYPGISVDSNNNAFFINGSDIISAKAPVLLDPLVSITGSGSSDMLSYVAQRHFARQTNGTLWAIWKASSNQILYSYSYNDGVTWASAGTLDTATTLNIPLAIVADGNDKVYAVVRGRWGTDAYDRLYFYQRNATHGWSSRRALTPNTYASVHPSMCVNSSNWVYLMYTSTGRGSSTSNYNIAWGLISPDINSTYTDKGEITLHDMGADQYQPTCSIDGNDKLGVMFYGLGWSPYASYNSARYVELSLANGTTWGPNASIYNVNNYHQYEGSTLFNSSNTFYAVWRGKGAPGLYLNAYAVMYRIKNTDGTWTTTARLDKEENYADSTPSVGRDRGDNITVFWMGQGYAPSTSLYNILYRTWTVSSNTWSSTAFTYGTGKTSYSDYEPHTHWQRWPECQQIPNVGWQLIFVNQTAATTYNINYYNSTGSITQTWGPCGPAPIDAAFSCTPTSGTINWDTTCTDLTNTSTPTSWAWEVWNSTGIKMTSTVKNPIFNFTFADQYGINLTVSDGVTTDSQNSTGYFLAYNNPIAYFNVTPTWGNQSTTFQFVDLSTGLNRTWWEWDLFDGNYSYTQNTSHKYPCNSGIYGWRSSGYCGLDVIHTVQSDNGTAWKSTNQIRLFPTYGYNITVYANSTPTVTFVANVTSGSQPLPVKFTPTTVDAIKVDSWYWDLGDGNTSTLETPSNVYWEGTYSISVTATNYTLGVTTVTRNNYIVVTAGAPPTADFDCTPLATIINGSIVCTDESVGATSWDWSSPAISGQQSLFSGNITTQSPTFFPHYLGGYFSLRLIACNPAGCDTEESGARYIWVQKYPNIWWGGW